jgi:hypothetical protein
MKHLLIFLFSLMVLFTTCITGCKSNSSRKFQADCIVVDMDGKPIIDRKVELLVFANDSRELDNAKISFGYVRIITKPPRQTQTTDNLGVAHFDVDEEIIGDFTPVFGFVPQDDTEFKAINYLVIDNPATSSFDQPRNKRDFKETLRMDKIKPLTIRLKASRNDIVSCVINTEYQDIKSNSLTHDLKRNIVSFTKTQTAMGLDTTFTVPAFVKQTFKIKTVMTSANGEFFISYDIVDAGVNRDSVLLIKF